MWFIPAAWCAAATCLACHSHHPPGAGRCWTAPLLSMKAPMKLLGLGVHIPSVGEKGTARVGGGLAGVSIRMANQSRGRLGRVASSWQTERRGARGRGHGARDAPLSSRVVGLGGTTC